MKKLVIIILGLSLLAGAAKKAEGQVAVGVEIGVAPPALPVYVQPPCPVEGYIWSPGFWAYGPDGYYWVPGVWVLPPRVGFWWTPGYWGFEGGFYRWHGGYWGPHVGFYGGVCYGFGYGGVGYWGGRWDGGVWRYNTEVSRVDPRMVHNTYAEHPVGSVGSNVAGRPSFNGRGGVTASPNREEQQAMHENHLSPTSEQANHQQSASRMKSQLASVNKGTPRTAAMNSVRGQQFNTGEHANNDRPTHSKGNNTVSRSNNATNRTQSHAGMNNNATNRNQRYAGRSNAGRSAQPYSNRHNATQAQSRHSSAPRSYSGNQHQNYVSHQGGGMGNHPAGNAGGYHGSRPSGGNGGVNRGNHMSGGGVPHAGGGERGGRNQR